MPRLLGVDIPNDRPTVISLTYLYGVGPHIARELCHKAGINPQAKARELHEDELARLAALELLMEHEVFAEIVLFSQLSPFELEPLFSSLARTHNLLTVEEGTLTLGWGAAVLARACETADRPKVRRVAALDLPIANSKPLEDAILPSQADIVRAALEQVRS